MSCSGTAPMTAAGGSTPAIWLTCSPRRCPCGDRPARPLPVASPAAHGGGGGAVCLFHPPRAEDRTGQLPGDDTLVGEGGAGGHLLETRVRLRDHRYRGAVGDPLGQRAAQRDHLHG